MESNPKIRPFQKNIARFPGEASLNGPPNTESPSVFNNPNVAYTTEFVAKLFGPHLNAREKDREFKHFTDFLKGDPDVISAFGTTIRQMQEKSLRSHMYDSLILKIKKSLPPELRSRVNPPQTSPLKVEGISIPEAGKESVLKDAIDLANACLFASYPSLFGDLLPILQETDVIPAEDENIRNLARAIGNEITHPFYRENYPPLIVDAIPDLNVFPFLPGKKIYIANSYLESINTLPDNIKKILIAQMFIHESMHRGARARQIKIDDTNQWLFDQALAASRNDVQFDRLVDFATDHQPKVIIEGALVILACPDEDGKLKQLAASGYDLNETVVEILSRKPFRHLYAHIRKVFPSKAADQFIGSLQSTEHQLKSKQEEDISASDIATVFKMHGLSDEEQLAAYVNGELPFLLHGNSIPTTNVS